MEMRPSGSLRVQSDRLCSEPHEPVGRLIFVNRFFHPDLSATAQLLSDLAFALAERGADVHIICSRLLYDDPKSPLEQKEEIKGVKVHRIWTSHFGRSSLLGRLFDYVSFYPTAALKLWRLARAGDQVVVKTDPPLFCVPAAWVCKWRKARLTNWLQDLYPELAMCRGILSRDGILGRLILRLRDKALRSATQNVAISQRMRTRLQELGVAASAIEVINNWSDNRLVYPVAHDRNRLRQEWGLKNKFVVAHSGNLGQIHDLETLRGALRVLANNPEICFLLIGGGKGFESLRSWATENGLTGIQFHPYQPREELYLSLSAADTHLVSLAPDIEGLAFASKFYGVLAAGRPTIFIGAKDSEAAEILEREKCGLCVEAGNSDQLVSRILELKENSLKRQLMGENASKCFLRYFDKPHALDAWEKLLLADHGTVPISHNLTIPRYKPAAAAEAFEADPVAEEVSAKDALQESLTGVSQLR